jgi:hypothetical protein
MSKFDPADAWTLRDAIMCTGGSMLAAIARARLATGREPLWWMAGVAPAPAAPTARDDDPQLYAILVGAAQASFDVKLARGDLICWARPGAPQTEHVELPWVSVRIEDWVCGTLITCGFDANGRFRALDGAMRYFDALIKPQKELRRSEKNKGGSPGNPHRRRCIDAMKEYLAHEGWDPNEEDPLKMAIEFGFDWIARHIPDGGPNSINTVKAWGAMALRELCEERQQRSF